jgi:hypothetical protein
MLPVVMGPHTVGKVSQPSFSIKGRSKLGSFSDDLHKARALHRPRTHPALCWGYIYWWGRVRYQHGRW